MNSISPEGQKPPVVYEETGYYTAEELAEARAKGKIVLIAAYGVAIVEPEQLQTPDDPAEA